MNFSLRLAIERARMDNMPKENIERSIKRGTGELKGEEIIEIIYEAMGPGNIMMIIKTATDNRNRTVSELKSLLLKGGGKMGEMGSAMWNFEKVGQIDLETEDGKDEEAELQAIEAGAKDVRSEEGILSVITEVEDLRQIQEKLAEQGFRVVNSNMAYIPKTTVSVDNKTREAYEKLLEVLDDQDDVEEIYDNL